MAKNKGTDPWNTPADSKADLAAFSKEGPSAEELADPNALINILPEETLKQRFARYVTESHATMSKQTDDEVIYWGLIGETGEVVELFKKARGHAHPLDSVLLRKELGDICWYVARVQERYGRKGEHGLEPFLVIGPHEELIQSLAQHVAGCTPQFMREAAPIDVTDRLSRILSYVAGLAREQEIVYDKNDTITDMQAHMEQTLFDVLERNKQKLQERYSKEGKFSTEESLNRKETDK